MRQKPIHSGNMGRNANKTLQGIKTGFSTPFQQPTWTVETLIKPCKGLKLSFPNIFTRFKESRNANKTLQGIKTYSEYMPRLRDVQSKR